MGSHLSLSEFPKSQDFHNVYGRYHFYKEHVGPWVLAVIFQSHCLVTIMIQLYRKWTRFSWETCIS